MVFKGVLLDFGDTLAYRDEEKFKAYQEAVIATLKKYGYDRSVDTLASAFVDTYLKSSKGELNTSREFWNLMLTKLKIPQIPKLSDRLQRVRHAHDRDMFKLYEGVPTTLSILQKKYKLALVSNCAAGTDRIIRSLDIDRFFDCITLSYQVGARKPNKRLYLEALRCLDLKANDCVFVADEISDLEGARNVELKTVLVQQGNSTFQEAEDLNFKPDLKVTQISEITKIL